MACHILGAPNMALRLGSPTSVECISQDDRSDIYFPGKSVVRFDFPERDNMPRRQDLLVRRDERGSTDISRTRRKTKFLVIFHAAGA